jgi:excisionase family DNA binding protein
MRQSMGKNLLRRADDMERRFPAEDEILTSEEARRFLKIGRTKLWDLTKKNLIPAYRVGEGRTSGLRYKRSELLRWLDNNRI